MVEFAGRDYIPKLYKVDPDREAVVRLLRESIEESGARLIYSSFPDRLVAPVYLAAEDGAGHRFGLLVYPFTVTRRETKNRPLDERRGQIRFGDPVRERDQSNPIASDVAGVDVTLVLAVDPEERFIVGLDPLVYADLPMGISVYYRDRHVATAAEYGWAVWEREKRPGPRRPGWAGLETLVGFRPQRFLDYVRFEAKATALGLSPGLRFSLANSFQVPGTEPHRLETFFGVDAATILDIVQSNFRLGIAVRGGVAQHHLEAEMSASPVLESVDPIDADGQPDFRVTPVGAAPQLVECKTASPDLYANGDHKVEVQKTRDSGAGRKYTFDQFDILAACLFPATGQWEFRYRWTTQLEPWDVDPTRIRPIQRVDGTWARSIEELLNSPVG